MDDVKMVIVVRRDLNMRKGKIAAQVAHASMKFLLDNNRSDNPGQMIVDLSDVEIAWVTGAFAKVVVGVDGEDELNEIVFKAKMNDIEVHTITDLGKTEFHGVPTLTCAALGPDEASVIDAVTRHLKLM